MTDDGSKVQCCKEQYCIETWNVRSMNQGKLEVVKQEIARVNIYVLGIRELRWTEMAEFNSDDHYIYYCGQEYFRRNWVVIVVNKSLKCSAWMQSQKRQNDLYLLPRQTIQCHSNLSLCPDWWCWRSWSGMVLWRPTRPFRTNTQKRYTFHYKGLECKSRKSRDTWVDRQIWPWSTKWSRSKANRALPREHMDHIKHPRPTTQEKTLYMDITRWSTPKSDWLYFLQPKMEKLYIVNKNKTRSWLWLRSWTPYCQIQTEIEESGENH